MSDPFWDEIETVGSQMREWLPELTAQVARLFPGGELAGSVAGWPDRIYLAGCGDSYLAGLAMELAFEVIAGVPCEPMTAMQFARYAGQTLPPPADRHLLVAISASGEVARTVEALQVGRHAGCHTLALTGAPQSRAAQVAGRVLVVPAVDHGITPGLWSYYASLAGLALLAIRWGEGRGHLSRDQAAGWRDALVEATRAVESTLTTCRAAMASLARSCCREELFLFLGAGPNLASAGFSAAKVTEAVGAHAFGEDLEEWAHLHYFDQQPGTPTFILAPAGPALSRAREIAQAARIVGRRVIVVTTSGKENWGEDADGVLSVTGNLPEVFTPLVMSLPGAIFAAALAQERGSAYFRGFAGPWSGDPSRVRTSDLLPLV